MGNRCKLFSWLIAFLLFSAGTLVFAPAAYAQDVDADGLVDSLEAALGTSQFDADSDDDGLCDGRLMDPASDDDGDGAVDEDLVDGLDNDVDFGIDEDGTFTCFGFTAGEDDADPRNPAAFDGDANGNRIYEAGETWTETHPAFADTDGDTLCDGSGTGAGCLPGGRGEDDGAGGGIANSGSVGGDELDPGDSDSDNDGILDGIERFFWENNPAVGGRIDTDGDGTRNANDTESDGDGVCDGTAAACAALGLGLGEDLNANGTLQLNECSPVFANTEAHWLNDGAVGYGAAGADGTTDSDGDGRANCQETDNDGDGLNDGGTPVTPGEDTDNNGILGALETNANDFDSDDDLLCDGPNTVDVPGAPIPDCTGGEDLDSDTDPADRGVTETHPRVADTDADGLNDNVENPDGDAPANFSADNQCNPLDADTDIPGFPNHWVNDGVVPDGMGDSDTDGVPNCLETDNDNDTLADTAEDTNGDGNIAGDANNNYVYNAGEDWTESNPNAADSDGDGLNDGTAAEQTGDGGDPGLSFSAVDCDSDEAANSPDECTGANDTAVLDDGEENGYAGCGGALGDPDSDGAVNLVDDDNDGDTADDSAEDVGNPGALVASDRDGVYTNSGRGADNSLASFVDNESNVCGGDSDGDGLPDREDEDGDGLIEREDANLNNILDAGEDGDGDTILDQDTDPVNPDSDSDNLSDGPTDPDGAGPIRGGNCAAPAPRGEDCNGNEVIVERGTTETDPLDADTDDDSLLDAVDPNPLNPVQDADGDGLRDDVELAAGCNPNNANTDGVAANDGHASEGTADSDGDGTRNCADTDNDNDGLADNVEDPDANGFDASDPCDLNIANSDNVSAADGVGAETTADSDADGVPNCRDADDDNDGIGDGIEDNGRDGGTANDGAVNGGETNLVDTDTDQDGLQDREDEDGDGVVDVGETNPTNADTDGDTVCDGASTLPAAPAPNPGGANCAGFAVPTAGGFFGEDIDGDENHADRGVTETDPTRPDTDNDGTNDRLDPNPLRAPAPACPTVVQGNPAVGQIGVLRATPYRLRFTNAGPDGTGQLKTIRVRVINRSAVDIEVNDITEMLAGDPGSEGDEFVVVESIFPALNRVIKRNKSVTFFVKVRGPDEAPFPRTATDPYVNVTFECPDGTGNDTVQPSSVRPVQLEVEEIRAQQRGGLLSFRAQGAGIKELEVKLFDLTGRLMLESQSPGATLVTTALNRYGQPLANGVYFYVVTVRGWDGKVVRSEIRKLVILR